MQLSGTASITSCLFEDNIAESGGGPAIFNIGYISKANLSSFLDNILDCENGTYLKFREVRHSCLQIFSQFSHFFVGCYMYRVIIHL